ncbi:MAG: 16S rRNA processing protein RimM [Coriobacteriales bacterium]|nr:16S rRNA processing protein RimM [Coriobacteriales bacterium]
MGEPSAYTLVARITKTKGIKGEVITIPVDDLPFVLYEGLDVWVVPPLAEGPRATQITAVQKQGTGWGVLLKGVDAIDTASLLVGHCLLARTDALDIPALEAGDEDDWLDCIVQDVDLGELGVITGIMETPAHPLWVITGPFGEVMLPAVDEFIVAREGKTVQVKAPQGLIDLSGQWEPRS